MICIQFNKFIRIMITNSSEIMKNHNEKNRIVVAESVYHRSIVNISKLKSLFEFSSLQKRIGCQEFRKLKHLSRDRSIIRKKTLTKKSIDKYIYLYKHILIHRYKIHLKDDFGHILIQVANFKPVICHFH